MINAIKKLLQGDTAFTLTDLGSGTVGTAEIAASAITGGLIASGAISANAIYASAVGKEALKYKLNTFSFLATASAENGASACSATYRIVASGKVIGFYLTKLTSVANQPIVNQATNSIYISVAQALVGTDVCEGVVVTIE